MDDLTHLDSTTKYVLTDTGKPSKDFFNWIKKLNGWISDATSNINNLNSELNSAWTSYTPVVTATAGTITGYTALGIFKQIGKTINVQMQLTITNVGSASGYIVSTLPVASVGSMSQALSGREVGTTGNAISGIIAGGNVRISYYNNLFPGGTGSQLNLGGTYEAA